jgi:hypothetical protein
VKREASGLSKGSKRKLASLYTTRKGSDSKCFFFLYSSARIKSRTLHSRERNNMDDDKDIVSISSAPGASRLRWHVFLSFRGADTRYPFIGKLYEALEKRGIRAFRDDDGLNRGEEIAPSLLEAIQESATSIVVISKNYASSRWCLEELSKICECRRLILPVFYQVDPSHVRKQKGPFEEHFKNHEEKYWEKKGMVEKWRKAMEKAGGRAGWPIFNNRYYIYIYIFFTILVELCF